MLTRVVTALGHSLRRDGAVKTALKAPKLARHLIQRLRDYGYYRRYWREEQTDGFDARYGTDTSRMVETFELGLDGAHAHQAVRYEPASVKDVLRALSALDVDHRTFTLVDLGSGKGRTLMVASRFPFKKLVGVELAPSLHAVAEENVRRFRAAGGSGDFELRCQDATTFEVPPGDLVYYLFNPFGAPVLEQVIDRLVASLKESPRRAFVLYVCPDHRGVIERTGVFRAQHEDPRFTVFANG